MKKTFIFLIIAIPLLSFTLLPVLFIRSDIKVDSLLVLPAVTKISVINKGSILEIDNDLSKRTFNITADVLQNGFPASVKTKYFSADSITHSKLDNFVAAISWKISREKQARKYHLPDSILRLFDTAKVNFVFCTSIEGFTRARNNLINTNQASGIANFLLGMKGHPIESLATITCLILDLKQKNILYLERQVLENRDPTDIKIIKLQLSSIINHFFI